MSSLVQGFPESKPLIIRRTNGASLVHSQAKQLGIELSHRLRGEVRFDAGTRGLYATGGSNYRQVPIGVVVPKTQDDVLQTLAICRRFGAPVLSRGGGTSLAGQCCNVAVIMDFSKYLNHLLELDPGSKQAWVEPGLILDHLRNAAEKHHLTFGPDPSTHDHCTLGGMIGNNSCGVHSVMAGRTSDNVEELEILTYRGLRLRVGKTSEEELSQIIAQGGERGRIYAQLRDLRDKYAGLIRARYPKIPRRVSGYNLDELLPENGFHVARSLVGTEGTCVVMLQARVRLVDSPPVRSLLVLGYPDVYSAADHVTEVMASGPVGLEGIDEQLVRDMKKKGLHPEDVVLLPEGGGWLLVEYGGQSKQEADDKAHRLMDRLSKDSNAPSMKLYDDPPVEKMIWEVREAGLGATADVPGQKPTWEGWEDSAVPPEQLGNYLRDFKKLLDKFGYRGDLYGHFGQGCLHTRIDFDLVTPEGVRQFRAFLEQASDLVLSHGGSLSGEHGDGQSRAELLPKMFGPELIQAFREFKAIWDPDGKMNPHKVVDPYKLDENLRLGPNYRPIHPQTHFAFTEDENSFSKAALRCVGVGTCRRTEGGTMCPSFMVTREEKHSTRGRAHLLFEMLQGQELQGGWKEEAVHDALDLCLACKGCKGDCPVNVDMATYKAEFLSHYYEGRLRPITAYSMGLIYWWARLASTMPRIANFISHAPVLSQLFKAVGGISQKRKVPRFAKRTFMQWFLDHIPANPDGEPVLLWPDTFNNHFHPDTAIAAVRVLEDAGYFVQAPIRSLCCGRPLYDYGMLGQAKRQLAEILDVLSPVIQEGIPVVGLEPSCVAVFRDEMKQLFPNDENAMRLAQQTFLLSEFLEKKATHYPLPQLKQKAMVHVHCHHRAVMKPNDEKQVLGKMGLEVSVLDSGCCGMAGSFGFEKQHYQVSQQVGERVLLPAVRSAPKDTLIVADGFSCREQIAQGTDRKALHLSEVLQMAIQQKADVPRDYPEQMVVASSQRERPALGPWTKAALWTGVGAVSLMLLGAVIRR